MADESTATAPAAPHAAPTKPKLLVLIAALTGGLVLGGAGGMFLLGPRFAAKAGYAATTSDNTAAEGEREKSSDHEKGDHEKGGAETALHLVDNLVLNPAHSGGTRFLMVAVAMELRDDKVGEEMTRRDAELRDTILRILGEKSVDQLSELPIREGLKKQILDTVVVRFGKGSVTRVFFPQFVIQ